jgi:hypothetical protein
MQRATLQPNHNFSYRTEVLAAARRTSIPPALLLAIIHAESNFNPRAVSHKGAVGLMQLYQGAVDGSWYFKQATIQPRSQYRARGALSAVSGKPL